MRVQVEKALETVRPLLRADGGDVELIDILANGIVQVRLTGACQTCAMSQMTLRTRIEYTVKKMVPGIKAVEAI